MINDQDYKKEIPEGSVEESYPASMSEYDDEMLPQNEDILSKLNANLDCISQIVGGVKDIVMTYAEMKMQIATVEAQVDAFCASLEVDLAKYQQRLPMLEKQLDRASDRIDKFVDKILSDDGDVTSPEYLQKQSLLLDALTSISSQFNMIIMKLL